jgi:hypothetical protein
LNLNLNDSDQNKDSEKIELLRGVVTVAIQGGDLETVNLRETADNSGMFVINNPQNELKISLSNGTTKDNNGRLEFINDDIHRYIIVTYTDPINSEGNKENFTYRLKLDPNPGTISISLPNLDSNDDDRGKFILLINDPDLNDNPNSKDSYTFMANDASPVPLLKGSTDLGQFAKIDINVTGKNNETLPFHGNKTFLLQETGVNTGIFQSKINVHDWGSKARNIAITYFDNMETPSLSKSEVASIGT